jgi:thiol-disulfide isomerase/thioredoxin
VFSACGSGDDDVVVSDTQDGGSESTDGASNTDPAGGVQENGPVEVIGTPLAPYDSSIEDLTIGGPSPVVNGESFDGTPITFGGDSENPTFVVFLAHWCPHCNEEIPELIELNSDGRIPDGLDVIGVSTAVRADGENYPPSQWMVDKNWPWPVMADDTELSAIAAEGGTSFPYVVVLDTDGTVLARRAGTATADETADFLEQALASSQA